MSRGIPDGTFCWRGVFLLGGRIREVILSNWIFSKLQTTFYIYWTSINVKTSMTCQYKEYEVKTKIVQEQQLYLKMKFLLNYNLFWALALECTVAFSLVQKYIFDCCSDPFSQFFPIYGERLYFQVFLNSLKSWEIGTFEIFLISYLPFWA